MYFEWIFSLVFVVATLLSFSKHRESLFVSVPDDYIRYPLNLLLKPYC